MLCFEYRIVTVEYFLDKMPEYEAFECIKYLDFVDKVDREMERYQIWVAIQTNSKKQLSMKDILSLPWDNDFINETEFTYNEEEEAKLNENAKEWENILTNNRVKFESTNML